MREQGLFVAPHFQLKRSARGLQLADDGRGPMPSVLFVEPGRTRIADRAGEPGGCDAACGEPRLPVRDERRGDAGPTCLSRHEKLIQLGALDEAESDRGPSRTDDSDLRKIVL